MTFDRTPPVGIGRDGTADPYAATIHATGLVIAW